MDVKVAGGEHPARSGEFWGRKSTEEGEKARKFGGSVWLDEWGELSDGVDHRVGVCERSLGMVGRPHQRFEQCSGAFLECSRVNNG